MLFISIYVTRPYTLIDLIVPLLSERDDKINEKEKRKKTKKRRKKTKKCN